MEELVDRFAGYRDWILPVAIAFESDTADSAFR
jgi:hypothetical protein